MEKVFTRIILKDATGAFLVIRDRAAEWNFPGGKLESGETPMACGIREVAEEIALQVSDLEEIYHGTFDFSGVKWQGYFYFAKQAQGIPALNEPGKIKGVQFVEEMTAIPFSPGLAPLFDYLAENQLLDSLTTNWL